MALSVEQKLAIEQLICEHQEWSLEYGFDFIEVDVLKEEFLPALYKIIEPK